MEGVTVISSFMFSFVHVKALLIIACVSLALMCVLTRCKDDRYSMVALATTIMIIPILLFATMNLNIPWQYVTIDETVIASEFLESYKIIDIEDGIYFVRPLDN